MDSRLYWIWLQQALGYGSAWLVPLLNTFSSPEGIFSATREQLAPLDMPSGVVECLCDKSIKSARGVLQRTVSGGDWLLTPADEAYPPLLRGIYAPPAVLYGRGAIPDFTCHPAVAVVGTRFLTRYGHEVTAMVAGGLARGGALVVSGGAEGGDAVAASSALDVGGAVVVIQACGLDVNYPAVNEPLRRRVLENGGTILTEYSYGMRVQRGTFHVRNRLLSGVAHGVCVTEAPCPSGALITARFAREQGRDVFAVPGAVGVPNSEGGNKLIQNGAKLVRGAEEILEEYQPLFSNILDLEAAKPKATKRQKQRSVLKVAQPTASPASDTAKEVLRVMQVDPLPVDEIAAKTQLTVSQVLAALTELEMLGLATSVAGQQYRRT